jgi:hypothetical protein
MKAESNQRLLREESNEVMNVYKDLKAEQMEGMLVVCKVRDNK